jgi:hypothetical protein
MDSTNQLRSIYTDSDEDTGLAPVHLAHLELAMTQKAPRVIIIGAGKSLIYTRVLNQLWIQAGMGYQPLRRNVTNGIIWHVDLNTD